MTMLAYHNDESIKQKYVTAMKADIAAERLQAGHYWDGETGCFVGCVVRGNDHSKFESEIGVPQMLPRIGDAIYEGLPTAKLKQDFAIDFLEKIKTGADLSLVGYKFMYWNLTENLVLKDSDNKKVQAIIIQCRKAIKQCAEAICPLTKGKQPDQKKLSAAARSAAESARSAAESAAARSAAESARSAAESAAARSAAESAAARSAAESAWSAAWVKMANKLIELIEEAV